MSWLNRIKPSKNNLSKQRNKQTHLSRQSADNNDGYSDMNGETMDKKNMNKGKRMPFIQVGASKKLRMRMKETPIILWMRQTPIFMRASSFVTVILFLNAIMFPYAAAAQDAMEDALQSETIIFQGSPLGYLTHLRFLQACGFYRHRGFPMGDYWGQFFDGFSSAFQAP